MVQLQQLRIVIPTIQAPTQARTVIPGNSSGSQLTSDFAAIWWIWRRRPSEAHHVPRETKSTTAAMPVAPSLYNAAVKRPWLMNMLKPLAGWYANAAGYRQLGLK
jgi:hypothetical protein